MNTQRTSRKAGRWAVTLLVAGSLGVTGCDFLDPTSVENPRTTADDLARAEEPTRALLPGLRAQFARLIGASVVVSEVVSDNYSIHGTGLFKEWDSPREVTPFVANSTGTATGNYWNAQELRALASFVIDDIAPNDEAAEAADVAEAHYYRGMAYLILAENFSFVPLERNQPPVPGSELLSRAVSDLTAGTAALDPVGTAARAALARAYRWQGDATNAAAAANAVLAADADFLFQQQYDAVSIENAPFAFLVLRALQEMQPLPRLDFLDPKYLNREAGIAVAKAEEMHLILAEIALASGSVGPARTALLEAIALADGRSTVGFSDNDPRLNADLSIRPRDASIEVRANASSPYISGLVLDRPGVTTQRPVSGTSLDPVDVAATTDLQDLWYAFQVARQEILFLEGRRMADLGIRLPMMLREIDANTSIESGDPGTVAVVPSYIPAADGMDLFTPASPYDDDGNLLTTQVTINVDMNRILVDNGITPFGS